MGARAAQFDGANNTYVGIPRTISDQFTVAFWMKTTTTGGTGQWWSGKGLVDGEVPGAADDFGISLLGNNAAFGVGNPDTTISTTTAVNDGNWHHVAATRDSVSGAMNLYLDGALQATTTGPQGTKAAPTALRIGSLQTGVTGGFFSGSIDDVQIFSRVCSPSEIPSLMNHAPTLSPVFDGSILAGRTLVVSNSAADVDAPAQTLSYDLANGPAGVAVNPTSGVVSWRPAVAQSGSGCIPFSVRVTDNGTPSMSATQTFAITVLQPARPSTTQVSAGNGKFQMLIGGDAGPDYSVYASTDVTKNFSNWDWLLTTNPASLPFQFLDPGATNSAQRFYRVLIGP